MAAMARVLAAENGSQTIAGLDILIALTIVGI